MKSYWRTVKLGDVVTFQRGHDLSISEMIPGQVPVIGSNGIIGHHNVSTTTGPSVVIGRSGNIGKPAYIKSDFWAHNTTLYAKEFHSSDPHFVYFLLQGLKLDKYNSGSAVPSLNRNIIHPIEVKIPPLPVQQQIAQILSSLDDKIELLREENKTLEAIAQTLFKRWFVDFEFPDENGSPYKSSGGKMLESELCIIPERWRVGKIGDEFKITMGQSPSGRSYNNAGVGAVFFQGRTDFQERFPSTRLYTTEPTRYAQKNDVLVSVRAPVGDINVANVECCIGRGLAAVNSVHKSYCLYKLKNQHYSFSNFESEGTVFGSMTKDGFNNIKVVIPPIDTIDDFETAVNPIDMKIFNNYVMIKSTSKLRDLLLAKFMRGEIEI